MHPDLDPQRSGLARLLRELPESAAAPYGYREFERRALARAHQEHGHAGGRRLAVAAVLFLAVLAVLLRLDGTPHSAPPAHGAAVVRAAPGLDPEDVLAASAGTAERWLASLPSEPAMVRVGTRAAVMGLEDRIAQVDDLLTATGDAGGAPERLRALQQERSRLVGTLVQVRYAQTLANASP
jgi:hypothetical protein